MIAAVLLAFILSACQMSQRDEEQTTSIPEITVEASPGTDSSSTSGGQEDELMPLATNLLEQYNAMEGDVMQVQQRLVQIGEEVDEETTEQVAKFNVRIQAFQQNFQNPQNVAQAGLALARQNVEVSLQAATGFLF